VDGELRAKGGTQRASGTILIGRGGLDGFSVCWFEREYGADTLIMINDLDSSWIALLNTTGMDIAIGVISATGPNIITFVHFHRIQYLPNATISQPMTKPLWLPP
jgi:hypothetical protein